MTFVPVFMVYGLTLKSEVLSLKQHLWFCVVRLLFEGYKRQLVQEVVINRG